MAKNIYYNGKLIPVKDWDYATSRPKVKDVKKKEPVEVSVELPQEVDLATEE
jgi:hypothetical protein